MANTVQRVAAMPSSENFDPGRIRSAQDRVYGIHVRLSDQDPLANLLGEEWSTTRWYSSEAERDAALADLRRQHEFSRAGDRPSLTYEKVEAAKPSHAVIGPRRATA